MWTVAANRWTPNPSWFGLRVGGHVDVQSAFIRCNRYGHDGRNVNRWQM